MTKIKQAEQFRNIAIVAHVDHGKTTLVDKMIEVTKNTRGETGSMDKNDLERERGITILAKATCIEYKDYTYHIVDTPGHADFGGEVERILNMVDGVIVLVDAAEGAMPQTRFVLMKAIENKKKIMVVVNKIDKPESRIEEVVDEIFTLLFSLNYPDLPIVFYGSGRNGFFTSDLETAKNIDAHPDKKNLIELLDTIGTYFPQPYVEDRNMRMLVSLVDYDNILGKVCIGKLLSGSIKEGASVVAIDENGNKIHAFRILKLFKFIGTTKIQITEAVAGEIIGMCGGGDTVNVNHTICTSEKEEPIAIIPIDPPTITLTMKCNSSPFAGKETTDKTKLTFSAIKNRLIHQSLIDMGFKIRFEGETAYVSGRGELQLGVILETMRREGYEFTVTKPEVVIVDGKEPIEELVIYTDQEYVSTVMNELNIRKGQMVDMVETETNVRLKFEAPTRLLIGVEFLLKSMTRGNTVITRSVIGYQEYMGESPNVAQNGVLISSATGRVTTYALESLSVSDFWIAPGDEVYEGQIVGSNNRDGDLVINPTKEKKLTNVRSAGKDETTTLPPKKTFDTAEAISMLNNLPKGKKNEEDVLDVTPKNIRFRRRASTGR